MYAELIRQYSAAVTIGEMSFHDDKGNVLITARTIELPDINNQTGISCIPEGEYNVSIVPQSAKIKYKHFWIQSVPNRDGIKIHIANYVHQLRGCVAVGKSHADLNSDGVIDVSQSTAMLTELLEVAEKQGYTYANKKTFKLRIKS